jgi:ABC-type transport system involved in multi-copper enzyme maturation permease subunit
VTALVGTELLKLRTTRAWIGLVLAIVAVSGAGAAGTVGTASELDLGSVELSRDVIQSSLLAGFVAFLIGITMVTSEWRHGTITRTFLVTPRRERVLAAKELAALVVGIALAIFSVLLVLAIAVTWLQVEGSSFEVDRSVSELVLRAVLAAALWGGLGVGFGAIVQSQTPAIVIGILWILIGEGLIGALLGLVDLDRVAMYFPGAALASFESGADDGLSPWAGGAVGLCWVVALGILGYLRISRRDVT